MTDLVSKILQKASLSDHVELKVPECLKPLFSKKDGESVPFSEEYSQKSLAKAIKNQDLFNAAVGKSCSFRAVAVVVGSEKSKVIETYRLTVSDAENLMAALKSGGTIEG